MMRAVAFLLALAMGLSAGAASGQEAVRVRCTDVTDPVREAVMISIVTGEAVPEVSVQNLFVVDGYEVFSTVITFIYPDGDGGSQGAFVEAWGPRMRVGHPFNPNEAYTVAVSCTGKSLQGFVLVDTPDFVDVVGVSDPQPLGGP